jgi:hypothetical protein
LRLDSREQLLEVLERVVSANWARPNTYQYAGSSGLYVLAFWSAYIRSLGVIPSIKVSTFAAKPVM